MFFLGVIFSLYVTDLIFGSLDDCFLVEATEQLRRQLGKEEENGLCSWFGTCGDVIWSKLALGF